MRKGVDAIVPVGMGTVWIERPVLFCSNRERVYPRSGRSIAHGGMSAMQPSNGGALLVDCGIVSCAVFLGRLQDPAACCANQSAKRADRGLSAPLPAAMGRRRSGLLDIATLLAVLLRFLYFHKKKTVHGPHQEHRPTPVQPIAQQGSNFQAPVHKSAAGNCNKPDRRKRRSRPGTVAHRMICKFQATTNLLIRKRQFQLLVCKLMGYATMGSAELLRIQSTSMMALQQAAEAFLVGLFEETNLCAIHARHVTVMHKNMQWALRLHRGPQRWIMRAVSSLLVIVVNGGRCAAVAARAVSLNSGWKISKNRRHTNSANSVRFHNTW